MLLSNIVTLPEEKLVDIFIEKDKISSLVEHRDSPVNLSDKTIIRFNGAFAFPGLINSHEHLDFNLFPQLGNKIYNNYVEWGEDIHLQNKEVIEKVLKIPKQLRIEWGIYKNLLNGITAVVNHGPKISVPADLITVLQNSHVLHSVSNERNWKFKLNMPFIKNKPFSIHIGEGTDATSKEEINTLLKWNLFSRELIGIHAVAMNEEQATKFKALVWCPDSNNFLLGQTAAINKLKHQAKILFGTDSTVSANWNLWEQLRIARNTKMATDVELFNMLTHIPADVWVLPNSGTIAKDFDADIVIGKMKPKLKSMDAFFQMNPEDILMVIRKGNIRLVDGAIYQQLHEQGVLLNDFSKIFVGDKLKYISGNLPELIKSVKKYYPEAYFPVTC